MPENPCCSVCHVYYVEGYSGPCEEFAQHATDEQIAAREAPMCPGTVSLDAAIRVQRERAERAESAFAALKAAGGV